MAPAERGPTEAGGLGIKSSVGTRSVASTALTVLLRFFELRKIQRGPAEAWVSSSKVFGVFGSSYGHLTGEGEGLSSSHEVGSSPNLRVGLCGHLLAGLSGPDPRLRD